MLHGILYDMPYSNLRDYHKTLNILFLSALSLESLASREQDRQKQHR